MFCVFEGIDGAGKTSLIQALKNHFVQKKKEDVIYLQEPTNMPTGKTISSLLKSHASLTPKEWLELFIADRRENVKKNIAPALEKKKWIIQDRYYYSTASYQGRTLTSSNKTENYFTPQEIMERHQKENFPQPTYLFYLEINAQKSLERIQKNRKGTEAFETLEYLEQVAKNYKEILPKNTIVLDTSQAIKDLCLEVFQYISKGASKS